MENQQARPIHIKKKARSIPFAEACSSGTRALVRLFAVEELGKEKPSLLFLDEFDAFYHHSLAESVLRNMLADPDMQVIATIHNTDLFSNKTLRLVRDEGLVSVLCICPWFAIDYRPTEMRRHLPSVASQG